MLLCVTSTIGLSQAVVSNLKSHFNCLPFLSSFIIYFLLFTPFLISCLLNSIFCVLLFHLCFFPSFHYCSFSHVLLLLHFSFFLFSSLLSLSWFFSFLPYIVFFLSILPSVIISSMFWFLLLFVPSLISSSCLIFTFLLIFSPIASFPSLRPSFFDFFSSFLVVSSYSPPSSINTHTVKHLEKPYFWGLSA